MKESVSILELEEYLFSTMLVSADLAPDVAMKHLREAFRMHRFIVFSWLIMNGASIPAELVLDQTHPPVGQQRPDQPV